MTFLRYVYSIKKNYIELHVYNVNGDLTELQQTMFVPFAPTRINAIDGTIEKQTQLTGFSIMSNGFNLCNIMMMTINGDEYAKNEFWFADETGKYERSFDETCNDFMQYTGFTDAPSKPNLVQWGEIVGGLQNQSDWQQIHSRPAVRCCHAFTNSGLGNFPEVSRERRQRKSALIRNDIQNA